MPRRGLTSENRRRGTSGRADTFVVGALVVIAVAVIWFAATRQTTPKGGPVTPTPPPVSEPVAAQSVAEETVHDDHGHDPAVDAIPRITIEELRDEMSRGEVVVIDVRNAEDYLRGHIPGSLQIPLTYVAGEVDYLPKDRKIVAYCT